jgi:hypothetical protein
MIKGTVVNFLFFPLIGWKGFPDGHRWQVDGIVNGAYPDDLGLRCMHCMDCYKKCIEVDD